MDAKIGDHVALDAKKVGQPKRTGVIRKVNKGLSGIRYEIRWDDGTESVLSPAPGTLTVLDGGAPKQPKAAKSKTRPKTQKKKAKPTAKKRRR